MPAPKTKGPTTDVANLKKSVQLIVFAPINSDENDEENLIYMVCPASLKVVEVIEKFDDEAIEYLSTLGKKKKRKEVSVDTLDDDLGIEFDGEIEVAGEIVEEAKEVLKNDDEVQTLDAELDEDIVTFASASLDDIFPDAGGDHSVSSVSDVDMADALALLDEEDSEEDLESLAGFVDADELPEL